LGLALLAKGATDVALDGGSILEEVLCLPFMEWVGGFERLLEVLGVHGMPTWLRLGGTDDRCHHLLPTALSVLAPLVVAMLG
jgi:hypothetical protein